MTFPARPRSRGRTMSSPSSVEYGHPSINSKHQSQTQAQTQGYRRHYDEGFGPGADRERRERFSASVSPTLRGAETPSLTVTHPLEPQGRRERDGRDQIFVRDHRETQTHRSHRSSPSASHIAHEQVVPVPPNTHPSIAHLPTRNNNGPLSISTAPPHTTSVMSTSTLCNMNSLNTLSFSYPSHPPAKRRRAKRTEEERIAYLRSDPYVAQFEAYRVLCASCDKWIRLRPNSTYCSIPWDAHRKSCLAKKIMNRGSGAAGGGGYALEERNAFLSKDPDVRKFDAERVLCAVCDTWIDMHPEDHLMAVRTWLEHRAECRKDADILTVGLGLIGMGAGIMEPAEASSGGMVPPVQAIPNNRKREDERNGRVMDVDRYRSESPTYDDHRHQRHPVHTQSPDSYRPRERDVYPLSSTDYRYHSRVTRGEGREHHQFENPTRTLDRRYESPHHASQPPFGGRETRAQRRLSLQYQQRPHPQRERSIASTSAASAPGEHDTDSDTSMDDEGDIDVNAAGDPGIKTAPVSPSRASSLHTTSSNGTQPSGAESRGPYATDSQLQQKEAEKEYHRRSQAQQQQVFNAAAGQFPPGPAHESRRRNAEQRAATLRADKLIKEVEANRVFCSLCMKWVQLRQDSSYCAYPWLQHRGKCLARHQRRAQKAAEIAEIKARRNGSRPQAQGSYPSNAYPSAPGPSHSALHARSPHGLSEMDMKAHGRREESPYRHDSYSTTGSEPGRPPPYDHHPYRPPSEFDSDFEMDIDDHGRRDGFSNTAGEFGARRQQSTQIAPVSSRRSHRHSRVKHEDMEYDEEGGDRGGNVGHEDIDMDRETRRPDHISKRYHGRPQLDDSPRHHPYNQTRSNSRHHPSSSRIESTTGHSRPHPSTSSPTRKTGAVRTRPVLADLDSVNGRRHFVYDSISHLFNTTYEVTDDMSVSTLLTYLNSAMPPDKYEDFDTAEVVRAVSCLKDKGKILLEGDLIKRVPGSN
ncbi:hypothetical protein K435DRAFT_803017 [Dendrothele bispora CBS 962.96]|uniref:Uncharacterized protein n=1 Tax=Dendrothele bispora (strain CBS 962.96) TaxID=1314807 RepID=A0A4S8LJ00_DENBC|nr:hypothetical protein K435DRAFT_803017 [Dendrothele bispora CBS 962.96]